MAPAESPEKISPENLLTYVFNEIPA